MKEGFKSIKEILEEVAEEEGLTINEIKDVWRHQVFYIKKLMESKSTFAILLPYIGTLSLNVKQFKKEIKGKSKTFYKNFIEKAKHLQELDSFSEYNNSHKRVTGVNRLARYIIKKYNTGIEDTKKLIEHNKCWEVITKYSNNLYKKK